MIMRMSRAHGDVAEDHVLRLHRRVVESHEARVLRGNVAEDVLHLRGGDELALLLAVLGHQRHFDLQTTPQTARAGLPLAAVLDAALTASSPLLVAHLHVLRALEHFVQALRIIHALEVRNLSVVHQTAAAVEAHARQHAVSTPSRIRRRGNMASRNPTWKISALR